MQPDVFVGRDRDVVEAPKQRSHFLFSVRIQLYISLSLQFKPRLVRMFAHIPSAHTLFTGEAISPAVAKHCTGDIRPAPTFYNRHVRWRADL